MVTSAAPIASVAMSAYTHSGLFSEKMEILSPGFIPALIR